MATANPYASLTQTQNKQQSTTPVPTQVNTTTSSNQQSNQQTNSQTQNMTPEQIAALNTLIQQLMGGGTQAMAVDRANVLGEININKGIRESYEKSDAFADAQGAMAQQMRLVLEKLLPSIVRAAEGAGTSQSSMRALLTQQAAENAAEASSALGLKAAVDYGNIATGLSGVIANLLENKDPTAQMLINALNVAKGSVQNTQSETNGTVNQQQTQQQATQYTPSSSIKSESTGVMTVPPLAEEDKGIGSTTDFLHQMYGTKPWDNYTF